MNDQTQTQKKHKRKTATHATATLLGGMGTSPLSWLQGSPLPLVTEPQNSTPKIKNEFSVTIGLGPGSWSDDWRLAVNYY